jgi:hypothetical protein
VRGVVRTFTVAVQLRANRARDEIGPFELKDRVDPAVTEPAGLVEHDEPAGSRIEIERAEDVPLTDELRLSFARVAVRVQ